MSIDGIDRVEARVAELSMQITDLRKELIGIARLIESKTAGHEERLQAIESFRRWMVGLMTGVFLSGVAAMMGWMVR